MLVDPEFKNTWFRELAKCKRSSLLLLTGPETVPYILQMLYFSLFALFSFKNSKWHTIWSQPLRMLNLRNSVIQDWKQFLIMARANRTGVYAAQLTRWTEGRFKLVWPTSSPVIRLLFAFQKPFKQELKLLLLRQARVNSLLCIFTLLPNELGVSKWCSNLHRKQGRGLG